MVEFAAEAMTAERNDSISSAHGPEHSRLLEAEANDRLAASLDHAGADEQMLPAELGIAHASGVSLEVFGLNAELVRQCGEVRVHRTQGPRQFFDFAAIELRLLARHPALLPCLLVGIQGTRQIPERLPGVIKIDDLDGAGKVLI